MRRGLFNIASAVSLLLFFEAAALSECRLVPEAG
jgi:hypothetical protein